MRPATPLWSSPETSPKPMPASSASGISAPGERPGPAGFHLPPLPPPPTRKIVIVDKPGAPQTALIAFGQGMPRSSPEYAAIDVMNSVLGGLFSSRINMNLREKNGYTYGAISGSSATIATAAFSTAARKCVLT